MRYRDDLIVRALAGMGVSVTAEQLKEARLIVDSSRSRMPDFVYKRRHRERKSGFSDPLLIQMGLSALPDAPSRPTKSPKSPELPGKRGRPSFGSSPMPAWVVVRRYRERQSGFSDPLLVQMGLSALPDAPSKPSRPSKIDAAAKTPKTPKTPKPSGPSKPPEMPGSGAWAASVSWCCS
jgi:hypothetical protein